MNSNCTMSYETEEICQRICPPTAMDHHVGYYEPSAAFYTQLFPPDPHQSQTPAHGHMPSEDSYWGSPCSSESQQGRDVSPARLSHQSSSSPVYQQYTTSYYTPTYDKLDHNYNDEGYYGTSTSQITTAPFVKVVKRRTTANKKERRRTQSINSAFSYLRERIPNVPVDTKLSKIKTLRLATSYISYLTGVLEGDQDPSSGFRAELIPSSRKINAERRAKCEAQSMIVAADSAEAKKAKGRTGWPQHVWASELKQE